MRDFKGMKRQRNRGRGGGGGGNNGGGKPQHNANRAFDSNGPDNVKVRGAAQHIFEKYSQLARDAGSAGDRVLAENYLQHAEHYFRVLRAMQPQRPVSEIMGRDNFVSGYDIDFEDDGLGGDDGAETETETNNAEGRRDERQQYQRDDRPRDDRQQQGDYRPRDERQPQGEYRQRDDRQPQGEYRQRDDRPRDDRPREDRQQGGEYRQRDDRYQGDRQGQGERQGQGDRQIQGDRQGQGQPRHPQRDDRPARFQNDRQPRQDRGERSDRDAPRDPLGVIEPQATPITAAITAPAPAYEQPPGEVLRGEDGATSHAPAFLQAVRAEPRPESEDQPVEARRPRRRRAPRTFEPGEAAPAEVDEA